MGSTTCEGRAPVVNLFTAIVVRRLSLSGSPVWDDVDPRKVAARYVQPDAMPPFENIRRGIELDGERIRDARLHQRFGLERVAKPRPADAVPDIEIEPAGEVAAGRVDVDQLGREIGITR